MQNKTYILHESHFTFCQTTIIVQIMMTNRGQVHYVISLAFLGDLQNYTFLKIVLYI